MRNDIDKIRNQPWSINSRPVSTVTDFSDMYHRLIVETVGLWREERDRLTMTMAEHPFDASTLNGADRQRYLTRMLTLTYDHIATPQKVIERLNKLERDLAVFEHLGTHEDQKIYELITSTLVFINEFRDLIGEWTDEGSIAA
jgi:hypothetical protein